MIVVSSLKTKLSKEYLGYLKGSFLDFMITIKDKTFCTKLFNERDNFTFLILRIP